MQFVITSSKSKNSISLFLTWVVDMSVVVSVWVCIKYGTGCGCENIAGAEDGSQSVTTFQQEVSLDFLTMSTRWWWGSPEKKFKLFTLPLFTDLLTAQIIRLKTSLRLRYLSRIIIYIRVHILVTFHRSLIPLSGIHSVKIKVSYKKWKLRKLEERETEKRVDGTFLSRSININNSE